MAKVIEPYKRGDILKITIGKYVLFKGKMLGFTLDQQVSDKQPLDSDEVVVNLRLDGKMVLSRHGKGE